jgi:hypothetical protein
VHPIPGPFFNTGISETLKENLSNIQKLRNPVLSLKNKVIFKLSVIMEQKLVNYSISWDTMFTSLKTFSVKFVGGRTKNSCFGI